MLLRLRDGHSGQALELAYLLAASRPSALVEYLRGLLAVGSPCSRRESSTSLRSSSSSRAASTLLELRRPGLRRSCTSARSRRGGGRPLHAPRSALRAASLPPRVRRPAGAAGAVRSALSKRDAPIERMTTTPKTAPTRRPISIPAATSTSAPPVGGPARGIPNLVEPKPWRRAPQEVLLVYVAKWVRSVDVVSRGFARLDSEIILCRQIVEFRSLLSYRSLQPPSSAKPRRASHAAPFCVKRAARSLSGSISASAVSTRKAALRRDPRGCM